jgi:hypothetical protein
MNNHGGYRDGAGRKPKAYRFAGLSDCCENKIADALPDILDALIEQAKGGDLGAARYLCDRILGRTAGVPYAPVADFGFPPDADGLDRQQRQAASTSRLDDLIANMGG